MAPKVVFVTGVTGAVGAIAARALVDRGATVILAARDLGRVEALAKELRQKPGAIVETVQLDLADNASIEAAARSVAERHPQLHALVNVAGIYRGQRDDVGGLEAMFATNHLGPFRLTRALLPLLRAGAPSRVVTVTAPSTSQLDWDDLQGTRKFSALSAFGRSKMANLLFAFELARREDGHGVSSFAFHPGLVKSQLMTQSPILGSLLLRLVSARPDRAGTTLAELAVDPKWEGKSGLFVHHDRQIQAAAFARDAGNQRRLWELSEGL